MSETLQQEVQKLLDKDAMEPVPPSGRTTGFYSHYFTVPKRDAGLRHILHLQELHQYIVYKWLWMVIL